MLLIMTEIDDETLTVLSEETGEELNDSVSDTAPEMKKTQDQDADWTVIKSLRQRKEEMHQENNKVDSGFNVQVTGRQDARPKATAVPVKLCATGRSPPTTITVKQWNQLSLDGRCNEASRRALWWMSPRCS